MTTTPCEHVTLSSTRRGTYCLDCGQVVTLQAPPVETPFDALIYLFGPAPRRTDGPDDEFSDMRHFNHG